MTRRDSIAIQIRLTPEECKILDSIIDEHAGVLGGSGITRTAVVRDLLVAELKKRDPEISRVRSPAAR